MLAERGALDGLVADVVEEGEAANDLDPLHVRGQRRRGRRSGQEEEKRDDQQAPRHGMRNEAHPAAIPFLEP